MWINPSLAREVRDTYVIGICRLWIVYQLASLSKDAIYFLLRYISRNLANISLTFHMFTERGIVFLGLFHSRNTPNSIVTMAYGEPNYKDVIMCMSLLSGMKVTNQRICFLHCQHTGSVIISVHSYRKAFWLEGAREIFQFWREFMV